MLTLCLASALLLAGADPALSTAAKQGNAARIKKLIAQGHNVNDASDFGMTALHVAAYWDRPHAVTALLEAGADLTARTTKPFGDGNHTYEAGSTALHLAAVKGATQTAKLLQTAMNAALCAAVDKSQDDLASKLLDAGAEAAKVCAGTAGRTALHIAAAHGTGTLINALIHHGAAVVAADDAGATPLHLAHVDAIEPLLAAAADVSCRDQLGRTPLLAQLERGDRGALLLLSKGAATDVADQHGLTPLHWAVLGHATQASAWLLQHRANAAAVTQKSFTYEHEQRTWTLPQGLTPLALCNFLGDRDDIAKLLRAAVLGADNHGVPPAHPSDNSNTSAAPTATDSGTPDPSHR